MSRLTIVALWTYSWHLQIISLFLAQSDAIMRAKHGPVGHLAIGHVELAPYIALLVSICASSGARAQITLRNIHPIGLLLFQAEFHVETGTHFCVNCAHRVKIPVVLFLAYCGLSAIWVAAEAKHKLHHLVEGAVVYNAACTTDLSEILLLGAYASLRGRDLWDVYTKYHGGVLRIIMLYSSHFSVWRLFSGTFLG